MVMGGDSCSEGCAFESWCCILDGHDIFHIDLLRKLYCLFERQKIKEKEAVNGPFKKLRYTREHRVANMTDVRSVHCVNFRSVSQNR